MTVDCECTWNYAWCHVGKIQEKHLIVTEYSTACPHKAHSVLAYLIEEQQS